MCGRREGRRRGRSVPVTASASVEERRVGARRRAGRYRPPAISMLPPSILMSQHVRLGSDARGIENRKGAQAMKAKEEGTEKTAKRVWTVARGQLDSAFCSSSHSWPLSDVAPSFQTCLSDHVRPATP